MQTKTSQITAALAAGDNAKALSLASKFFDRTQETRSYKQAQAAAHNPSFYRQLGKDPDAIVEEALATLRRRFGP